MMWSSPNNDNPWGPFRCHSSSRCEQRSDGRDARKQQTLAQSVSQTSSEYTWSNKKGRLQQALDPVTFQEKNYNFDDNGNANMPYTFVTSGLRNVIKCDKQTQTDSCEKAENVSMNCDVDTQSTIKRIYHSKSCERVVRKSNCDPHASHSCVIGNIEAKQTFDSRQIFDISQSKTFEDTNCMISPIFRNGNSDTCIIKPQHAADNSSSGKVATFSENDCKAINGHESTAKYSQNEFGYKEYSICPGGTSVKQHFSANEESESQITSWKRKNDDSYKNQWSPFQNNRDNDKLRQFYDYREPDEVSLVSERSCYSTTSDEEWDSYDIVDWDKFSDDYNQEELRKQRRSDAYNTPPTTPTLDLSALDGYQTAPNSPRYENQEKQAEPHLEKLKDLCALERSTDCSDNYKNYDERQKNDMTCLVITDNVSHSDIANNASKNHYEQNLCCKCGKAAEPHAVEHTFEAAADDNKVAFELLRQNARTRLSDSRVLQLELPPLISVNSVHYEADPETGRAKVIGRGSFGQVYKARFSDPLFYHLPIVIKEFNEEFTESKDIIDEAKRLLYLQDTGYVPICYGLLCFGSPSEPKYGIVQEYVGTGLTLEQMLWDQYELPLEFWFRIVLQCCEGLAKFHEKGILLNDIKTNNILLEFSEHTVRIRYIDFGLATDMRGKRYKNTKSLEDFVYLAPEVRQNGRVTSVASDIYSLGYILEQINKYTGLYELTMVSRLCMDKDPEKRLPIRSVAKLIKDQMQKFGFGPWSMDFM